MLHTKEKKLDYSRWRYGVSLIHRLRDAGFSVREVSRIATQNGDLPGWSEKAAEHRGLMAEHQIRNMEAYLKPKVTKGRRLQDPQLTPDQRKTYRKHMLALRQTYRWSNSQIAAALNMAESSVVRALQQGAGSLSRLQDVTALLDTLKLNGTPTVDERIEAAQDEDVAAVLREAAKDPETTPSTVKIDSSPVIAGPPPDVQERLRVAAPPPQNSLTDVVAEVRSTGRRFVEALERLEDALPAIARPAVAAARERAVALVDEVSR